MRDYYDILGVPVTAFQSEIRDAYLRLSKSLHPDINPHGTALFRLVDEAYDVLRDEKKRTAYDQSRKVAEFPGEKHVAQAVGTVDLTKLIQAFVPPQFYQSAGPALERMLQDRGITPHAASVEQVLEATGLLQKKRRARAAS